MIFVQAFFSGFFFFNSLPHLVSGINGQQHMTPFKRVSSAYLNLVWAFINILLSLFISGQFGLMATVDFSGYNFLPFLVGGFVVSMADAQLFGNPNARLPWQKD